MAPPPPPPPPPAASFPALCIALSMLLLLARAGSAPSASSSMPRRGRRRQAGTADAAEEEQDRESSNNPAVILDSGASYHAAADRRCLAGFDTAAGCAAGAVHRTRDGTELPAAGAGTLASEKFQLPDVLHIPGLLSGTVLVAVQLLARWGYLVMFGGGQCLVMDRTSGELVGQGRLQEDGLYRLDFLKIPPLNASPAAAAAAADGTESNNGGHGADSNVM